MKSPAFSTAMLASVFQRQPMPEDLGTQIFVALYAGDPMLGGEELNYPGYARAATDRSGGAWAVVDGMATNMSTIPFPQSVGTKVVTATHAALVSAKAGPSMILYSSKIASPLKIGNLDAPRIGIGALTVSEG